MFHNGRYTTNIPQTPTHSATTDVKTNMRHIHTYNIIIVARHLATRGNNNTLRTSSPDISSYEEILSSLTRRTLAYLRTNKSPFPKSYLHKVDAKHIHHHHAPSVTLTHTTPILSSTAPTMSHIRTTVSPLDLWTDPHGVSALLTIWTEKLARGP